MKIPMIGAVIDERSLNYRLCSSSLGGIAGGLVASGLFGYRFYLNHFWSWDLFAVIATILVVKLSVLTWYRLND